MSGARALRNEDGFADDLALLLVGEGAGGVFERIAHGFDGIEARR